MEKTAYMVYMQFDGRKKENGKVGQLIPKKVSNSINNIYLCKLERTKKEG